MKGTTMRLAITSLGFALTTTCLALTGCYETATPVLGPGVEAAVAPGAYRCRNDKDRDEGRVHISAPARIGANDVTYVVTVDKDRYAVRAVAIASDLYVIEARGADLRGAGNVFLRRTGADSFDLMAARAQPRDRLAALARTNGVTITFSTYGTPQIDGPPERLRAFFLAHTSADLERTSICRRIP
jgi:hypothetical protein